MLVYLSEDVALRQVLIGRHIQDDRDWILIGEGMGQPADLANVLDCITKMDNLLG